MTRFEILRRADELYGLPGYVKAAEAIDEPTAIAEENQLVDDAFADGAGRKFPVHNTVATFLSAVKFAEHRLVTADENDTEVLKNIFDAAERFNTLDDVTQILGQAAENAVKAASSIKYALDNKDEGIQLFRVDTLDAAIESLDNFYSHRHQLPLAHRKTAAAAIINGIGTSPVTSKLNAARVYAEKLANAHPVCSGGTAAAAFWTRAEMMRRTDPAVYSEMDKLARDLAARETVSGDEVHNLMNDLEQIDLMSGLYHQYGRSMRLPEEIMLAEDISGTKIASAEPQDPARIFLAGGLTVPVEVVRRCGFDPFGFAGIPEKVAADQSGSFNVKAAAVALEAVSAETAAKYVHAIAAHQGPGRQKMAAQRKSVIDFHPATTPESNDIFNFST